MLDTLQDWLNDGNLPSEYVARLNGIDTHLMYIDRRNRRWSDDKEEASHPDFRRVIQILLFTNSTKIEAKFWNRDDGRRVTINLADPDSLDQLRDDIKRMIIPVDVRHASIL